MVKTVQPENWSRDRRRRNRRLHVKLSSLERLQYIHWYAYLHKALHKNLRRTKEKVYVYKPSNSRCVLPQDAVRAELRHVFREDWKCELMFNDIDKQIHMLDRR